MDGIRANFATVPKQLKNEPFGITVSSAVFLKTCLLSEQLRELIVHGLKDFRLIAFTHQNSSTEEIGKFHIEPEQRLMRLSALKAEMTLNELFYLSTCNRVEFFFISSLKLDSHSCHSFLKAFNPGWSDADFDALSSKAILLEGEEAARHLFSVAASLDSLVVGEREIITQVRAAYDFSSETNLSGDGIRLLIRKVIESAKDIFTATPISRNPVSVVSLAYRELREMHVPKNARIMIAGAGITNSNLSKYLKKHGFRNFVVFNRSISNAEKLADQLGGRYFGLDELSRYDEGFDVLISCTSASGHIFNPELYRKLLNGDADRKVVIDLAVPSDVDPEIYSAFPVASIHMESLKQTAQENIALRRTALEQCEEIIDFHITEYKSMIRQRKIELAMMDVPRKVKEIRAYATEKVFASELESLDENSREVVERMLSYLEKKYISVPMKLAKEIMLDHPA